MRNGEGVEVRVQESEAAESGHFVQSKVSKRFRAKKVQQGGERESEKGIGNIFFGIFCKFLSRESISRSLLWKETE